PYVLVLVGGDAHDRHLLEAVLPAVLHVADRPGPETETAELDPAAISRTCVGWPGIRRARVRRTPVHGRSGVARRDHVVSRLGCIALRAGGADQRGRDRPLPDVPHDAPPPPACRGSPLFPSARPAKGRRSTLRLCRRL